MKNDNNNDNNNNQSIRQRMQSHNEPKCGNTESKQTTNKTTTVHTSKMECIAKRKNQTISGMDFRFEFKDQ